MAAMIDAQTMLIPAGQVTTSQDFPALELHPRQLTTCHWILAVTVPPVASVIFTLAVATTQNGAYSTIATFVWPAGTSGAKQVPVGLQGNMAWFMNNQALWLRASVQTSGALSLGGSWLSKSSDGGPGLGSRSYHLDGINAL